MHANTLTHTPFYGDSFESASSFFDIEGDEVFYGGMMPGFHITTVNKTRRSSASENPFGAELEYNGDDTVEELESLQRRMLNDLSGHRLAERLIAGGDPADTRTGTGVRDMVDAAAESPWRQMRIVARFVSEIYKMSDYAVGYQGTVDLFNEVIGARVHDRNKSVRAEARRLVRRLAGQLDVADFDSNTGANRMKRAVVNAQASITAKPKVRKGRPRNGQRGRITAK